MPVLTLYRHGVSMGVAPMQNPSCRAPRDVIVGWSPGAARRNLHFLQSIDERHLTGIGWALTLTVRDCPESPELWQRLIRDYFRQVGRALGSAGLKLDRYHYVTEWQKRGVPHLHGAVYISGGLLDAPSFLKRVWIQYAGRYGASPLGQYVLPIAGAVGWFQYVSKHAARGIKHYQRSSKAIPGAWQSGTGRMWGKGGDWPITPPVRFDVGNPAFHTLRRWARAWRVADARSSLPGARPGHEQAARRRVVSARHCLRSPDRYLSEVRGVSEWIPEPVMQRMVTCLSGDGDVIVLRES